MTAPPAPLRIDIVSDVVCPWCIIGYLQLSRALEATGTAFDLHWHPFELNPDMPAAGQNLRAHIMEKYGTTAEQSEQSRQQITAVAAGLGFDFRFSEEMRMYNTFNAHQLLHWAEPQGGEHKLKLALFAAYFTDRRDLSDPATLADIAGETGLDRDEALAVLQDQRFGAEVRAAEALWHSRGISAVPAVVFDQRHLVTGAQGVENYTAILRQLEQMKGQTDEPRREL